MNVGYDPTVKFKAKLDVLIEHNFLQILWISSEIARKTWQIFEQFNKDKQWSFTDCTSYVVMKQSGITEAFTFDRHFFSNGLDSSS
jgi:predicted nucleic acid-binding protein